ncbi:MAG TPA: hypothetical protein VHX11_01465 [Acidobacteriaceae bacterium]|jgi:hypothetical protein|nr:hypothetical protein [Acidobacteriaceae bacterium]
MAIKLAASARFRTLQEHDFDGRLRPQRSRRRSGLAHFVVDLDLVAHHE